MSIGYIASGGIGNRAAAISSYVYDSQYKNINLIWEPAYYGDVRPEHIWSNWTAPYFLHAQTPFDCRNWYIHANAAKSNYVKAWWKSLRLNSFIISELNKFNQSYECLIYIRNLNTLNPSVTCNYDKLCSLIENIPDDQILVASDNNTSINILLDKSKKLFHYYKTPYRIIESTAAEMESTRSENDVYAAMIDWYLTHRAGKIYKINQLSTFTDFAEFICEIPTELV